MNTSASVGTCLLECPEPGGAQHRGLSELLQLRVKLALGRAGADSAQCATHTVKLKRKEKFKFRTRGRAY